MPGAGERVELFKSHKTDKIDVTFNPNDLEDGEGLTEELIRRKYQEQLAVCLDPLVVCSVCCCCELDADMRACVRDLVVDRPKEKLLAKKMSAM
jgi:hypothetical protein